LSDQTKALNFCIIRQHRLGDVLQSLPLAQSIKQTWPQSQLTYVTSPGYQFICQKYSQIDQLLLMNLPPADQFFNTKQPFCRAVTLGHIANLVDKINTLENCRLVNLHSEESFSVLAGLTKTDSINGRVKIRESDIYLQSKWSSYLSLCVLFRKLALLNLADGWTHLGGGKLNSPPTLDVNNANKIGEQLGLTGTGDDKKLTIAFQPGSADPFRRWPPEYFTRLGNLLAQQFSARIVTIGSPDEKELCNQILSDMDGEVINAAGYGFEDTLSILKHCSLLITNDTGPMHLAAMHGIKVVALFFGPSTPLETGAYAQNVLSMLPQLDCIPCNCPEECTHFDCRNLLTPEKVSQVVKWAIHYGHQLESILAPEGYAVLPEPFGCQEQVRVYASWFNQDMGIMEQIPLVRCSATEKELQEQLIKWTIYRFWWNIPDFTVTKSSQEGIDKVLEIDLVQEENLLLDYLGRHYPYTMDQVLFKAVDGLLKELESMPKDGHFDFFNDLKKILCMTKAEQNGYKIEQILSTLIIYFRGCLNQLAKKKIP